MKILSKVLKKIRLPYLAILPTTSPENWQLIFNPTCASGSNDAVCTLLLNAKNLLLGVGGGIGVLLLVYAGFMYVTAYGNEERATQAKKIILWTIVGLIIIMGAELLIGELINVLS